MSENIPEATPMQMPGNPPDRITCHSVVHYEHAGDEPVSVSSVHYHELETEHQPYQRRAAVGLEFLPIDMGWVPPGDVGVVVVHHRRPTHATMPAPEVRKEEAERVIYVRLATDVGPGMPLRPGASIALPVDGQLVELRCNRTEMVAHITVFGR